MQETSAALHVLEERITESDALRRLVDEARDVADHEALLLFAFLFLRRRLLGGAGAVQYRVELLLGEAVDTLAPGLIDALRGAGLVDKGLLVASSSRRPVRSTLGPARAPRRVRTKCVDGVDGVDSVECAPSARHRRAWKHTRRRAAPPPQLLPSFKFVLRRPTHGRTPPAHLLPRIF